MVVLILLPGDVLKRVSNSSKPGLVSERLKGYRAIAYPAG